MRRQRPPYAPTGTGLPVDRLETPAERGLPPFCRERQRGATATVPSVFRLSKLPEAERRRPARAVRPVRDVFGGQWIPSFPQAANSSIFSGLEQARSHRIRELAESLRTMMWLLPIATWLGLFTALSAGLWAAFRWQWWRRVHYHTLLGPRLPDAQVHRSLIRTLVEFDRVATPGRIVYWMDAGTLLGAFRDQKLIAWDDDLDVCIPLAEFERLWALAGQFQSPYRLVKVSRFWSIDKLVPGLARLFPCQTFLRLLDGQTQLYIDIFTCGETADGELEILPYR